MTDQNRYAAIYTRYSTDRQDSRSLDDQERRCRARAAEDGCTIFEVYADAAASGARGDRDGLERLMRAASRRPPSFGTVYVDDLSRLSRDLGATFRIVFGELAAASVKVVDVNTGLASDGAGARLAFGAMALVNDTFLQLVRTETHRGLQGRALGGFWTGGRVFGFATVDEENAPDAEHIRKRPVIDVQEAAIVLRVFRGFAEGIALKQLAFMLNEEGVPAPHDGAKGRKIGRGWGHTTIRAMLRNERYIGHWTWNTSKWISAPGGGPRRRVKRPANEHVVRELPDLAIVDLDLWNAVQARFRRNTKRGRPAGAGCNPHLITGLLRCGTCAGSMTIVGGSQKAGVKYPTFGCTAHYSRGAAICSNNQTISERKATAALVGALQDTLSDPILVQRFVIAFEARLAEHLSESPAGLRDLEDRLRDRERRVARLTEAVASGTSSEALLAKLVEEERLLAALKAESSRLRPPPLSMPSKDVIASYSTNLLRLLETDVVRGREVLARHLSPVVMTPEIDEQGRRYRMSGAFNIAAVVNAKTPVSRGTEVIGKKNSGGRI